MHTQHAAVRTVNTALAPTTTCPPRYLPTHRYRVARASCTAHVSSVPHRHVSSPTSATRDCARWAQLSTGGRKVTPWVFSQSSSSQVALLARAWLRPLGDDAFIVRRRGTRTGACKNSLALHPGPNVMGAITGLLGRRRLITAWRRVEDGLGLGCPLPQERVCQTRVCCACRVSRDEQEC